jgi:hypothetical protein
MLGRVSVPVPNGHALSEALLARGSEVPRFEAYIDPDAGHDTDRIAADLMLLMEALRL